MKRTIIVTLACLLTVGMQASDYLYLVFTQSNGTTTAVTASDLTISFNDGYLVATSGSTTLANLELTSLTKMEFSNDDTSGIEQITVNTLISDEDTVVYDLNGRKMPQDALPKGVYIVKNSKRTFKMQIK